MKNLAIGLTAGTLIASGLVACGNDEQGIGGETTDAEITTRAGGGGGAPLLISAPSDGELRFDESKFVAVAGPVTISFENPSQVAHNVEFEDSSGRKIVETETVTDDSTDADVQFGPGTYTFYCSVDGHRQAGMEGTLRVR